MPQSSALKCLLLSALVMLAVSLPASSQEHHWGYEGEAGPTHWADLNPEYKECKLGKEQSPVNIDKAEKSGLAAIHFNYQPSRLAVVNNGHTIQNNYAAGSTISVDGKTYELAQFHFHHLSETTVKGKHAPLEVHLVHKSSDGKLAVVAVLLREGKANPVVESVWSNLPNELNKPYTPDVQVNAAELLPPDRAYYTFPGSLTTPPCSEGVTWIVMQTPVTVSKEQIANFAKLYPDNFRPTQPLNGRVIKEGGAGK